MGKNYNIEDIFSDPEFNSIKSEKKTSYIKTEDERLIDAFEEINIFVDKNSREPNTSTMSEYGLLGKLKNFRQNEVQKKILKPYDRHNLLGHVVLDAPSIEDVLNDDEFKSLNKDEELSIFRFKHVPNPEDRAETDFVAQRKPMKEKDFKPYEEMFFKVHKEIKEGRRKIVSAKDIEKHLRKGHFYIADGIMFYLEDVIFERDDSNLSKETSRRKDGRTRTIFENGTYSNLLYRSLAKNLQKNGKMITNTDESAQNDLFVNANLVQEEDIKTGWIYILKSKSKNPMIKEIKDLYKIGFSSVPVDERIRNAKNEATYLYADVKKITAYACYNRNADKLEQLLHRFFAEACLNVDLYDDKGQRITPREWFVVPLQVIEEAIQMILKETIVNFKYNPETQSIIMK